MTPTSIAEANAIYDRAVARAKTRVGNEPRAVLAEMTLMALKDADLYQTLLMTAKPALRLCVVGRRV